jgi:hypothetical protein
MTRCGDRLRLKVFDVGACPTLHPGPHQGSGGTHLDQEDRDVRHRHRHQHLIDVLAAAAATASSRD